MFKCIFNCMRGKDNLSYLDNIDYNMTTPFIPPIIYGKVYDGDTITITAKLPYKNSQVYHFSIRLNGIDSPEIKGQTKTACYKIKRYVKFYNFW